jgi:hypothetical protein
MAFRKFQPEYASLCAVRGMELEQPQSTQIEISMTYFVCQSFCMKSATAGLVQHVVVCWGYLSLVSHLSDQKKSRIWNYRGLLHSSYKEYSICINKQMCTAWTLHIHCILNYKVKQTFPVGSPHCHDSATNRVLVVSVLITSPVLIILCDNIKEDFDREVVFVVFGYELQIYTNLRVE